MKRSVIYKSGLVVLLLVSLLLLATGWVISTESGLQWLSKQIINYAPAEISINRLEGKLTGPMTVSGLSVKQEGTHIQSELITLDWLPMSLFTAKVEVSKFHINDLRLILTPTEGKTEDKNESVSLPDVHLPVRISISNVQINNLEIQQPDSVIKLNQIKLDAHTDIDQLSIDTFNVVADKYEINVFGKLNPNKGYKHVFNISWKYEMPSKRIINGKGDVVGDLDKTIFNHEVDGALQLTLDATLTDLLGQLKWQADVELKKFDTAKIDTDLAKLNANLKMQGKGDLSTANISGNVDGNSPQTGTFNLAFHLQRLDDNGVRLEALTMNFPETESRIDASGSLVSNNETGDIALTINWHDLRWPLTASSWFRQANGTCSVEGELDNYQIIITSDLVLAEQSGVNLTANAEGNLESINVHSLRLLGLDGEANAHAKLSWEPTLNWQAEVSANNINPATIMPDWPGSLKANINSQGRMENDQLIADATVSELSGVLRNYPVTLNAQLDLLNDVLNINEFKFKSGKSELIVGGKTGDQHYLSFNLSSPNLAELYPRAKGQFNANGQLTGSLDMPIIGAAISGKTISLSGYEIASIKGNVSADINSWQQVDIKITSDSIKLNQQSIKSINLVADSHHLSLNVIDEKINASINLRGTAYADGWRGEIEQAYIKTENTGEWNITSPAKLEINSNTFLLDSICWQNNGGNLCAEARGENGNLTSKFNLIQMPLATIDPWLPPDLKLEGLMNANAEVHMTSPDILRIQANVDLPSGALSYPLLEGERDRWEYSEGKIDVVVDEQGLTAASNLDLTNGDHFKASVSLPDANLMNLIPERQALQANAKLSIHDPGLIEAMLPDVQDLKGELDFSLAISGTLDQPQVIANGSLNNGALRIPALGLHIDSLSMKAESNDLNTLDFRLNAHSGDGDLVITGETLLDKAAAWPTSITIKGENVQVSRIPEARVIVTPDLLVKIKQGDIDITGKVHIPQARLQPKDISSATKVSDDVVIISSDQEAEESLLMTTKVKLTLGDRVNFYGYGFEGRFSGNLLLEDTPGQPTRATGEIMVPEGLYAAYGQRLKVDHGRILYTGGPVTNPGLDLRAIREVNEVIVGLKVRGSLSQPQVELFSIPTLGETDTLAYLLLGRPIENTSGEEGAMMSQAALALSLSGGDRLARSLGDRFGLDEMRVESSEGGDQASLVLGRYLSPKLYVSYGVGLIEGFNTLNLRYQLSDRLQLKAESGEHQGADIIYTIER